MADVTATFAAKDQGVAAMIQRLENKLTGFQTRMSSVSASAKRMQGSFANLGRSVVGLAGAYIGVTAAITAFNKAMDFGGRMNDLSEITGESAGNLAVLERAFDNTGVGGEKMMPMLGKMTEFIQNLEKGQAGAVATANKLGITFADLKNKSPIERFQMLLRAVAGLTGENDRLNASQDIFGTRMGGRLIPLIKNFSTEMQAASKQLGSVVEILNRNSAGIDEFGDRVQKAIAAKPMEFIIGVLDEMTGRTKDLAKSISEIDAAGFGQDVAKMFSGAMKAPELAFLGLGEILLLGIKKAGNALLNATIYAGKVYAEMFSDSRLYKLIGSNLLNVVVAAASTFGRMMLEITKTIVSTVSKIPGMQMVDPFGLVTRGITAAQDKLAQTSKEAAETLFSSMKTGSELMSEAATKVQRESVDYLDAAAQRGEVSAVADRLRGIAAHPTPTSSGSASAPSLSPEQAAKRRQEIDATYAEQLRLLSNADISSEEYAQRLKRLNQHMYQALGELRAGSMGAAVNQNAMPQAAREEMARQASAYAMPTTAQEEVASEPTLKRAVDLLAELNTKLPQPVLV